MGDRGGINRATAILLALIGVMLVLIAIPSYRVFRYRSQKTACIQSLKSAGDGLIIEYLGKFKEDSIEDAMKSLDEIMPERPNLCPAGGTVYLIKNDIGIYEPVCGLHETDRKLRVRLNASRGKDLLGEALRKARYDNKGAEPESVEIRLNGKPLTCERVGEVLPLRRGTATTNGYKGIVCYYGIEGDGITTGKVGRGEICYFVYADEDHAAVWRADDGWTGDAYIGVETK